MYTHFIYSVGHFRPLDFDGHFDVGLVHHAGLLNLAFPILLTWSISPCGEPLVQIRRGLRPLRYQYKLGAAIF
jgi:hypothetical protein